MTDITRIIEPMTEDQLYNVFNEYERALDVMRRWGVDTDEMYSVFQQMNIEHCKKLGISVEEEW